MHGMREQVRFTVRHNIQIEGSPTLSFHSAFLARQLCPHADCRKGRNCYNVQPDQYFLVRIMPNIASATPVETAFTARSDLQQYGPNARLLFALQLRFQIEDIQTVAINCLTDAPDDCKCDLIYVDQDSGVAVVAQGYEAANANKKSAPSNKAATLGTAASWLLARQLKELPVHLQPAAKELRTAIKSGTINSVQFWYVHNLPESSNVGNELATVEHTAETIIQRKYDDSSVEEVLGIEVGQQTLEEWYQALSTPILVTDHFKIASKQGYSISGDNWEAYATAVPARWLYEIFQIHKDKLFSANLRGYLGSRRSDSNINHGIKMTADKLPGQLWVFNNGITALVHDYDTSKQGSISIHGLSIVNGAQTTGAIGSLKVPPKTTAMVQVRFVKCGDSATVEEIIKCNNSQNLIEASDFRSNDAVQKRLRKEFEEIPNTEYQGCRRGGYQDFMRRPGNIIPSDTAAQALAAFHNNPVIAYNRKSQIWLLDDLYSRYFFEDTRANHIVLAYSLLRCIQQQKLALQRQLNQKGSLPEARNQELAFLRKRGASFLLVAALASCIETFLDSPVPNRFRLSFGDKTSPQNAEKYWEPVLTATLSFHAKLLPALEGALGNPEDANRAINDFKSMVDSTRTVMAPIYKKFADRIKVHA